MLCSSCLISTTAYFGYSFLYSYFCLALCRGADRLRDAAIRITLSLAVIKRKTVTVAMVVWSNCHPISALLAFTLDKKISLKKIK